MPELKFSKSTDSEHEIKLESALISAAWKSAFALGGETAAFEIRTCFVGDGAPVKVAGKSEGGQELGKIKGKMRSNVFSGEFPIPEDIELDEKVFFEFKLSKNGISGDSNHIPAGPPVHISNIRWSAEEARRGDTLTLSADVQGLRSGTEVTITIYEYDRDGAHDRIAEIPCRVENEAVELQWDYEYHEDTDEVPTEAELEQYGRHYNPPEYFFTIKCGGTEFGREQESGLLTFKDWLEITLANEDGSPSAGSDFVVTLADGTQREGSLDSDGRVRLEDVPPGRFSVFFEDLTE